MTAPVSFKRWIRHGGIAVSLIAFIGSVFSISASATDAPVVLDSQEVVTGDHSITYERIVPPVLKPQPANVPVPAVSIPPVEEPTGPVPVQLTLISQQVDTVWSEATVQWDKGQATLRTTLPLRHLESLCEFKREGREVSLFHLNTDPSLDEKTLAQQRLASLTPLPTRYIWTSKTVIPPEVKQAVEDLHRTYDIKQAEFTKSYFNRQAEVITEEKALKAHPPEPKDIVIQYFPIRSSVK